jgi:hypothetical protein
MANRYRYVGETSVVLEEHDVWNNIHFTQSLSPGDEFDAPEGWKPEPYPHPELIHLSAPTAPHEAPLEESEKA